LPASWTDHASPAEGTLKWASGFADNGTTRRIGDGPAGNLEEK
jgi:hypothetical protein